MYHGFTVESILSITNLQLGVVKWDCGVSVSVCSFSDSFIVITGEDVKCFSFGDSDDEILNNSLLVVVELSG